MMDSSGEDDEKSSETTNPKERELRGELTIIFTFFMPKYMAKTIKAHTKNQNL